jgi:sporulation protein YlmC with PRC-barrel domain
MRSYTAILAIALASPGVLPALGESPPHTLRPAGVDFGKAAAGERVSRMVGSSVANDANETVGKVDDVILYDDRMPSVVLSVGGFLGVGRKLVALPYDAIRKVEDRLVMPGATRDALKSLPEFEYAAK